MSARAVIIGPDYDDFVGGGGGWLVSRAALRLGPNYVSKTIYLARLSSGIEVNVAVSAAITYRVAMTGMVFITEMSSFCF